MAVPHGKNTFFEVDDSGGTPRDISPHCDNVTGLPGARALSEITAFGDAGERFIPGLQGLTFTVSGNLDTTADSGTIAVLNGLRTANETATFTYGPAGNGNGMVSYSGECWLENFTITSAVKDRVSFSATFRLDDGLTVGTFST